MEILEENIEYIQECRQNNLTYQQISQLFKEKFPQIRRGFSDRNIRLICSKHGLKKVADADLDQIMQGCVNEVFILDSFFL